MCLTAPERLQSGSDEAHVWRARMNQEPASVHILSEILAPDERQRADRFHFRRDREHFTVARGALRLILSRYLDLPPELIRFSYNQVRRAREKHWRAKSRCGSTCRTRAELRSTPGHQGPKSGSMSKSIREDFASLEIAERFFSSREIAMLRRLLN